MKPKRLKAWNLWRKWLWGEASDEELVGAVKGFAKRGWEAESPARAASLWET